MNIKYLTSNLLNAFFVLVESFLAVRFILKLFGANAANGFVNWVYEMSGSLLEPFREIFPTKVFHNTFVLEFSTIFAMVAYSIAALLIISFLDIITSSATIKTKK